MTGWADVKAGVLARPWTGMCERCNQAVPVDAHHRWLKGQGGPNVPGNLAALCRPCHEHVQTHPAESVADGWIVQAPYDYLGTPIRLATAAGVISARLRDDYGYDVIDWAA